MKRDIFIISVYCLVADSMQIVKKSYKLRSRGFALKLSDAEVITIEICGEFFKLHEDTEISKYFKKHYLHFFPNLPDRTNFVRQSANLWQVKFLIQMIITELSEQRFDDVQSIDTLPLPVCTYTRDGFRDRRFFETAEFGHCAAKKPDYYGFKLGLSVKNAKVVDIKLCKA